MNYFNARFDITDGGYYDGVNYRLVGDVIDNTGNYFAYNAQVGDIIYVDGSFLGFPLLRYKIIEINSDETAGSQLSVIVKWDMLNEESQEPFVGMNAIIGAIHSNNLTANLTSLNTNGANEILINNAQAYQTMLLGNNSSDSELPDLIDINKKIKVLEDKIASVNLEWEDINRLSFI